MVYPPAGGLDADDAITSNVDTRSKSLGTRLATSAITVGPTLIPSAKIGYPTHANACASKLEQMNRVALHASALGAERGRSGSSSSNRFRRRLHACVRSQYVRRAACRGIE